MSNNYGTDKMRYHFWKQIIVKTITWICAGGGIGVLIYAAYKTKLSIWDAFLIGMLFIVIAIAVTFSNSYGYNIDGLQEGSLLLKAATMHASVLHASFCWNIVYFFLTIAPLYCTCVVIYLSGFGKNDTSQRILIYSILSLVLSTSTYVINAKGFAAVYRNASNILIDAIIKVQYESEARDGVLITAIKEAEEKIRQFETER